MASILLALIFYSKIYRKKEEKLMHAEISYVDIIAKFEKNPVQIIEAEVRRKGFEYGKMLGLSESDSEKMINSDLSRLKK